MLSEWLRLKTIVDGYVFFRVIVFIGLNVMWHIENVRSKLRFPIVHNEAAVLIAITFVIPL